tara:strand:+ start:166 stop:471 length:306 start_codon:yes stop_codon:yes gene_type:complete
MVKKKKDKNPLESFSKELKKDLEGLMSDILEVAKNVVEEYGVDTEQISGSINELIQIHEDSPYVNEMLNDDQWDKVLNPNLSDKPEIIEKDDKKSDKNDTK